MRKILRAILSLAVILSTGNRGFAQSSAGSRVLPSGPVSAKVFPATGSAGAANDLFGTTATFIENAGQYGEALTNYPDMGRIMYGYEGLNMPVLFTPKGLVFLQRVLPAKEEGDEARPEDEMENATPVDRTVTMEWMNANPNPIIVAEEPLAGYHTYGLLQAKAGTFRKITYRELYPGVDVEYYFVKNKKEGFEYNIVLKPGADINAVKMRFGGDVKSITTGKNGELLIGSDIDSISQSLPVTHYEGDGNTNVSVLYSINKNTVGFSAPNGYDASRRLVVDPFVTSTSTLTGTNAGKAKDIDFDYTGNIYVSGGGDGTVYKLAKYDPNGGLQWTFSGSLAVPAWTFGTYYGGWVVEKTTGNVYLGQGFQPINGFQVIRLSSTGIYDNYITTGNPSFREDWKMIWSCNNGSPQILIAGGGTNSNINFGLCSPPSTTITSANVTGIAYTGATGWAQDIADVVIDPATSDMYTIYGSLFGTPSLSNQIYKNTAPYSAASVAWTIASGFATVSEAANRPYLAANGTLQDNSCNILAINSNYFFYWDGKNLKAFSKATGAAVGTPIATGNTAMMEGGIVADECNNIYVGSTNGTIKVYRFTGSIFDDAAEPDITITGFTANSVYDLVYNEAQRLLYACGDGFVASIDISAYDCASAVYTVSVNADCVNLSASATISPTPPSGSTVTYILYIGTAQGPSNTTGVFTGLSPNVSYSIHAIVNQTCSGTQTIANFTIPAPNLAVTKTDAACGSSTGSITATGSNGQPPLLYSINGTTFQSSGNFTGLSSGVYTIIVRDANGCQNSSVINIVNTNGPSISLVKTDASCGNNNGSITATGGGGTAPYQYSTNGTTFQSSNIFSGLSAGTYVITIRDTTGCINSNNITLSSLGSTTIAFTTTSANCGNSTGSITANVSGGVAPYQYSINGTTYQLSNVFTGLAAGSYTLTVRDASNCVNTAQVTIANHTGPQVTATASATSCNSFTGSITVTTTGGTSPFQYSVNGGTTYQASNVFPNLPAGNYTITVRDANGCISTTTVTINLSIPQVTATTTAASCNVNDGTIVAYGTGGITPYQYSINGTTFQSGNAFTGLAAGSYTLIIKDANGCTNSITPVTVTNATGLTISATSTTTSCTSSTGTITVSANGGAAPLTYSTNGTTFQSSNVFTGLSAGTYTVTVKDSAGCRSTTAMTISMVQGPSVTATATTSSCNNNNGTITATGAAGTQPYQYSINGTTYQTGNTFSGLAPGAFTVTIKDANGCTSTASVSISNVGSGTGPHVTATTQPSECGQSNGRITASGGGGSGSLKYSIDGINYQSSSNFQNLPAGTYTVYIKDATGCINFTTVVVADFAGPQVSAVISGSVCGGSTGSITATGFGGTAPYRYSIDGGVTFQTSAVFTGLASGYYTLTVRDAANVCRNSIVVFIGNSNGPAITISKTDAYCAVNNGAITVTASGGTSPYSYSINGVNFQSSNAFTSLGSGQYIITVRDTAGCTNATSVTINNIAVPQVTATSTANACNSNNGTITLTGTNGTTPYQYSINGGAYQSGNVFNGLSAGAYTVTLRDSNGCSATTNVGVGSIQGPQLSATASSSCSANSGSIIATGSSGTMPYQYSINGTTFQTSFVFTGLSGGSYTVIIRDANGCTNTAAVSITSFFPTVSANTTICTGSSAQLSASGGCSSYAWSPSAGLSCTNCATPTAAPSSSTTYHVTISCGQCSQTFGLTVNVISPPAPVIIRSNDTLYVRSDPSYISYQWYLNNVPISGATDTLYIANQFGSYTIRVTNQGCNGVSSPTTLAPLPIELLSFTGHNAGSYNVLEWITASEVNNNYFTLEHSGDGISFSPITTMKGAGNSTSILNYQFEDHEPLKEKTYYRLRQTDFDGKFSLSNIIVIANRGNNSIATIFPNPAHDELFLNYFSIDNREITCSVYDIFGHELLTEKHLAGEGFKLFKLDIQSLVAGTYFLKIRDEGSAGLYSTFFIKM